MDAHRLQTLLDRLPQVQIGVIGDFCLDVYWTLDMSASEVSLETGLPTRPVRKQSYSLGGAGNVVSNLTAMGVGTVQAFGVIGADPFGRELRRLLTEQEVVVEGLLVQDETWDTPSYVKPISGEDEENRLDLGGFNHLSDKTATALLDSVRRALGELDLVIINQQLTHGIHTTFLQQELHQLIHRHSDTLFLTDCRQGSDAFPDAAHKLNEYEALKLCGAVSDAGDLIARDQSLTVAGQLYERWHSPLVVTRGSRGCIVMDDEGAREVHGLHIVRRTDPVGAGDSMTAGIGAALAAGATPLEAATFGNFVAGVTVQKLFQTGVASPEEILAIGTHPDYVYNDELADDPRQAVFIEGTDFERVETMPRGLRIEHAIFDHDGTISTLRQGWEQVMEPVMIKAILGPHYESADETTYNRVVRQVREFIERTTGIQTLVQMQGLVELVKQAGHVPQNDILDEFGYKKIYNDALMDMVSDRLQRLRAGSLDVSDFTVKRAPELLQRLHEAGVRLYLASGTDEKDVKEEAAALGYGPLFEGRIYGAVGDVAKEAKRIVLDRILEDIGKQNINRLVTFGDGPVEIRETRKRGGFAVGIASDEVRRFGFNADKRARLVRAGAALIVPDFSQLDKLLALLNC